MKVTYQGVPGAYSDLAAKIYFGPDIQARPASTFDELFQNVISKKADYGIVPIENSTTGSIYQNYDLLAKHKLFIVGEIYLKISHNLLALPGTSIKQIKRAYSHPQAILQCQKFFQSHPWIKAVNAEDTAGSAKDLKSPDEAAIASTEAAKIYKLKILAKDIQTNKHNYTRFVIINHKPNKAVKSNKVSIMFTLPHKPGSLYSVIQILAKDKINMTRIESRPILGKPWQYLFYIDFEHPSLDILKAIKKHCAHLRLLGHYLTKSNPQD